jgi:LemA protein
MPTVNSRIVLVPLLVLSALFLSGCGYNAMQGGDEGVKAAWAEVLNQYQRRADLIPNLVRTVEGFAQQERDVLIQVTEARARVGSVQATPETLNDPAAFQQFQAAQGQLSSALSRLLVVVEQYPELKATQAYRDLQVQLEGTENRIAVERQRYNEVAREYNTSRNRVPAVFVAKFLGFAEKAYFESKPGAEEPPKGDF